MDAPWQCVVSLRFTTDSAGQPLGQARNEQFGDIIYDKAKVEERIRRAQRAILSPHKSRESFLDDLITADTVDPLQLKFSMNCVTLQISGPDVADLSFCDLPGMLSFAIFPGRFDFIFFCRSNRKCERRHGQLHSARWKFGDLIHQKTQLYNSTHRRLRKWVLMVNQIWFILIAQWSIAADFENQGAHRLAKQYDPQGKRTIGMSMNKMTLL
jgi:hypothetical protein